LQRFLMRDIALTENTASWRAISAALCANLVGVGLARFAYTPLIPALIAAHWYSASSTVYLGAANLTGYLAGALLATRMTAKLGAVPTLRAMMTAATAAFFACAYPLSFWWYFVWRVAAGVAGGVLMALAAPLVLAQIPVSRRGLASGAIFMGSASGLRPPAPWCRY
jgi:MFS family permease